jgi:hypothetical protein
METNIKSNAMIEIERVILFAKSDSFILPPFFKIVLMSYFSLDKSNKDLIDAPTPSIEKINSIQGLVPNKRSKSFPIRTPANIDAAIVDPTWVM